MKNGVKTRPESSIKSKRSKPHKSHHRTFRKTRENELVRAEKTSYELLPFGLTRFIENHQKMSNHRSLNVIRHIKI